MSLYRKLFGYRIRVNYKSGRSEKFTVRSFEWKYEHGMTTFTWETLWAWNNNPIHFNAEEVESVWRLR